MAQWYEVIVYRAHRGAGRMETDAAYFWAENPEEVLKRYRTMPGVKRSIKGRTPFPNISPIDPKVAAFLETRILREGIIPLQRAKKTWYYSDRI